MADIADADLPVFPFRVNWKQGIVERLEWKTDILPDFLGNEQRRSLRPTPRREFEVTLSLWNSDRQFWDLWLHRLSGSEFLFPLWHDSVRSTQAAPQGQKVIRVDTRGLEFKIGSYGLLRGLEALSSERFLIAEVHDDYLVAAANLQKTWRKGTRVEPLVRGWLTDRSKTKAKSSRVSETTATIQCTREQPYDQGVDTWDQYQDLAVVTTGPNRTNDVEFDYRWSFNESDSLSGRRSRVSDQKRAFVTQTHDWWLRGRTAKRAFRQFLYRVRGAAVPVWMPTFNEDLTLSRDNPNGNTLYVKACGWAYTGGKSSGREYIYIQMRGGARYFRRITGTVPSGVVGEERLALDVGLPDLTMAGVAFISYMDTARFNNDKFEFNHINAADGMSTVAGVMHTFRDEREAPAILQLPIPQSAKGDSRCGVDFDPCALPPFVGWKLRAYIAPSDGSMGRPSFGFSVAGSAFGGQDGDTYFVCADPETGKRYGEFYFSGRNDETTFGSQVIDLNMQGQDSPECPFTGEAVSIITMAAMGPGFDGWKSCPLAVGPQPGETVGAGAVRFSLFGNFPEHPMFEIYSDPNDPRWL